MDEDLLKRNTDCVYFLASPLTCKKGANCEYRHHEIARLNPRDCWYWLSGNCLNPTCAFRHPPLEGHTGVPSEPTQSSLPANKTTVPCYFFFNGFCNKGDRCSFLHGPDHNSFSGKPVKNDSGISDAFPLENKTSSGSKTSVAAPTVTYLDPSEIAPKDAHNCKFQPIKDLQQEVPKTVQQQNISPEISAYEYKEATVISPASLLPEERFLHSISHICTEQSAEEQVNSHIEPEERWESSPGFDVLVEDEMENLGHENDSEYLPVLDRERRELNGQCLQYEFKDRVEYDPICPEADILYEQEMYNGYRCMDDDYTLVDDRKVPAYTRERIIDSLLSRKRFRMPAEMAACDRNLDLRDHLRRRREVEINGRPVSEFLRRHESFLMIQNQERHRRHSVDQRLSRRLTSEVGLSMIDSNGEVETLSVANKHGIFRHSQQHISRKQHYKEKLTKRQFISSKISGKPVSKQRRSIHESRAFAFNGPKTLAEIKEEKKKAAGKGYLKSSAADFQDPKPLSEILKDKKRLDSVRDGNTCND
ncbi:zinc finger CCCH domain-containing protein 34 [Senna tora]|uniref:Zinc finger CCCH domain-containing protein 34 n=1 Tax=Senna tora TaxID=362788 RepID=A0A835CDX4_9FABA|nr:zinc finger CCCH domain-containing protein 34 [Senna tora]